MDKIEETDLHKLEATLVAPGKAIVNPKVQGDVLVEDAIQRRKLAEARHELEKKDRRK